MVSGGTWEVAAKEASVAPAGDVTTALGEQGGPLSGVVVQVASWMYARTIASSDDLLRAQPSNEACLK